MCSYYKIENSVGIKWDYQNCTECFYVSCEISENLIKTGTKINEFKSYENHDWTQIFWHKHQFINQKEIKKIGSKSIQSQSEAGKMRKSSDKQKGWAKKRLKLEMLKIKRKLMNENRVEKKGTAAKLKSKQKAKFQIFEI